MLAAPQTAALPSQARKSDEERALRVPPSFDRVVGFDPFQVAFETIDPQRAAPLRWHAGRTIVEEFYTSHHTRTMSTFVSSNAPAPLMPLLASMSVVSANVVGPMPGKVIAWEVSVAPERTDALGEQQKSRAVIIDLETRRRRMQVQAARSPHSPRAAAAIRLLESWLTDDTGYDERTWPELKSGLEDNRLSDRRLFSG